MFAQQIYTRRPVITTYRRKTRIEHFIDSSDDDSDPDERQQQQQQQQQQPLSAIPLVQDKQQTLSPTPFQALSTPSCQSEKQQTGPPLISHPVQASYTSISAKTPIPNQQQQQQRLPDYANHTSVLDLLPLTEGFGLPDIPANPLVLTLQQLPNADSAHLLLQEQSLAISYEETSSQNTPQGFSDSSETQTPTMCDDIRLLSFSSSPMVYDPATLPVFSPPSSCQLSHTVNVEQPQEALNTLDFLESQCPKKTHRSVLAIDRKSEIAQQGTAVEPGTIDFSELPSSSQPQLAPKNTIVPELPAGEAQSRELIQSQPQWTGALPPTSETRQPTITKQPDVFDFPSSPPLPISATTMPSQKNCKTKTSTKTTKDIFDFPDEDPNDEVIVPSSLSFQEHQHNSKKKKMRKKPMVSLPTNTTECGNVTDKAQQQQKQRKQVRFAPEMQVSTFREQSFERDDAQTLPVRDKPIKNAAVADENRPPHLFPWMHHSLKRKRNLISGLKSAAGVAATQSHLRRYNFDKDDDDDDDDDEIASAPDTQVQIREEEEEENDDDCRNDNEEHGKAATPSWLDLLDSESEKEGSPVSHRPQYQPQNVMNVRVTYGRHRASASRDPEMVELDNLLAQLRDCK
ncbi:hypothetical protein BX666DRAFT_1940627 [Dichotomocladium elegans]|nr:hypothetical protein BX666DRAFT_1940627 [Dichotomocladium elegans]